MLSRITVVKVGGNEIDDARWLERLARAVAARTTPLVLVHGGGREVTELQRTLGAEPEWFEGLRVTTPEGLRAVSMVLSGLVNKRLASLLIGAVRLRGLIFIVVTFLLGSRPAAHDLVGGLEHLLKQPACRFPQGVAGDLYGRG